VDGPLFNKRRGFLFALIAFFNQDKLNSGEFMDGFGKIFGNGSNDQSDGDQ
jgi:hypothetical protein